MDEAGRSYADKVLLDERMQAVHEGLLSLGNSIEARKRQSEKFQDAIQDGLNRLRRDQRELEERLNSTVGALQRDLESLRVSSTTHGHAVDELVRVVQELRQPVIEIIALRSRVAGLILGLGVLGSVAMWLAEPVYRRIVEHHLVR